MADERKDSIEQGVGAPEESPRGAEAAEERRRLASEGGEIGGGLGGTSDADTAGDESSYAAQRHGPRPADTERGRGEGAD